MSNEMNPLASLLGGIIGAAETDDVRRQRMETRSTYEIAKVAGIALTAICVVAALFAMVNGMLCTTLIACGAAVVALDIAKIGMNGVNMMSDYSNLIRSAMTAAARVGISNPNDVASEALLEGTIVLGTCLRPMWADRGPPGSALH